jgi:hypothetical protein
MTSALYGCGQHHQLSLSKRLSYDVEQPIERSGTCPACIFWIGSRPLKTRWTSEKRAAEANLAELRAELVEQRSMLDAYASKVDAFTSKVGALWDEKRLNRRCVLASWTQTSVNAEDALAEREREKVPFDLHLHPEKYRGKANQDFLWDGRNVLRTCTTAHGVIASIYKLHPSWLSTQ